MKTNTYIKGNSLYHKADVRAKLLFTLLSCILIFLDPTIPHLYCYTAFAVLLCVFSVGAKETFNNIKLLLPIVGFMILFLPLQSQKGEALLAIKDFVLVSDHALNNLLLVANRFIFISLITALLLQTSTNNDLLLGLRFFRLPYNAALVISLALCFIPSIASVFSEIRESQSLRLPNPEEGEESKKGRFKKLFPSLTAVLVYAIKSIPITASGLELRGFRGKGARTSYNKLNWGFSTFTQIVISVILPLIIFTVWRNV